MDCSVIALRAKKMAERGGFEPPVPENRYDGLATRCLRPLSHLSAKAYIYDTKMKE